MLLDDFLKGLKNSKYRRVLDSVEFKEQEHPRGKSGEFTTKSVKKSKPKKRKPGSRTKANEKKKSWESFLKTRSPEDRYVFEEGRKRKLKIPPGWKDLWINPDSKADMQIRAKDSKGRTQYVYTVNFFNKAKAEKFNRAKKFNKVFDRIYSKFSKGESDEDKVLYLIANTGFRVGGDKDTKAKVQAYGASTLRGTHIKVKGDVIDFDFIGKEGVRQEHSIKDSMLASHFRNKAGKDTPLFNTNHNRVRARLKSIDSRFKVKDFRLRVGNEEAIRLVASMPMPKSLKEKEVQIKLVSERVSKLLGNTPKVARESYINEEVFSSWN